MLHKVRWTPYKIAQRIKLIEPLVYRQKSPLTPFRYNMLSSPLEKPPLENNVDDSAWEIIQPKSYWGKWRTDFILRSQFQVPADWSADIPVALYLPLGDSHDFSHPEALAYIDEQPFASSDRHHQEILLPASCHDGKTHSLALHGWAGGDNDGDPDVKLYMRECAVVQIDIEVHERESSGIQRRGRTGKEPGMDDDI